VRNMDISELRLIYRYAKVAHIKAMLDPLNATMLRYKIGTPLRQAHFLAQIGHESGELRYREELASGAAYEGRRDLGNTEPGDGKKFKGRGLIQLTGRANYAAYGTFCGVYLLDDPGRLALDDYLCADVAGWYWQRKSLNELADKDDIRLITRRINGGLNGLDDRKRLLALAKQVLNVSEG